MNTFPDIFRCGSRHRISARRKFVADLRRPEHGQSRPEPEPESSFVGRGLVDRIPPGRSDGLRLRGLHRELSAGSANFGQEEAGKNLRNELILNNTPIHELKHAHSCE